VQLATDIFNIPCAKYTAGSIELFVPENDSSK